MMQKKQNPVQPPHRVDVLLFDDFSNHCLANTVEPLRAANSLSGRALYEWRFLTLSAAEVTSSSGLRVAAHGTLGGQSGDILIVMPSYRFRDHTTPQARRALIAAQKRYRVLGGFDTGSWLLADAGLLNGYRATIHWEELENFAERFPEVQVERTRRLIDRDRISCGGVSTAFELILDLIGQQHGAALRLEVALLFMVPDAGIPQDAPLRRGRIASRAVAMMQENLEQPLSIPEIAKRLGRPQRDVAARLFADYGSTPQAVYRRIRLLAARKMVQESSFAVSEIALRCGYQDASALTRAFRAEFGTTPRQLRRD